MTRLIDGSHSTNTNSSLDAIMALISAITLSPEDATQLTDAVQLCVASPGGNTGNAPALIKCADGAGNSTPSVPTSATTTTPPTNTPSPTTLVSATPAPTPSVPQVSCSQPTTSSCVNTQPQAGSVPIPNGHYTVTYNGLLGVVAQWQNASTLVIGVSGASFCKVSSVHRGWKQVEDAIDDGLVKIL
ncbi:hypothetical protein BDN67DRAFT_1016080 [Paxillus ammoniavirescens]|nr:hypothetical protein BDN67DRAFT_1016080 [Paxillus ammoniavirescens]